VWCKLLEGQLDVAIVKDPDLGDSRLSFYPLFRDEVVAVVGSGEFKKKKFLKAADFADRTVIVHKRPADDSTLFQKVLTPASVVPKKIVEIVLTEAIIEMVRAGLGVATMARWAVRPYVKNGGLKLLPLLSKRGVSRTWYAVTLKPVREPAYLRFFLSCLERFPRL
jgi:LysR family transcriptional regulator for metE and metH